MSLDCLTRRCLLATIRCYRLRWSGRGPFALLRCTFAACESCAAFGERAALQAPSTAAAVARIGRRLWRCRHLSLYRWPGGVLGGGRGFDRWRGADGSVWQQAVALAGEGESRATIAAVVAAARALASGTASPGPAPALLVRDGPAVKAALARRSRTRALASVAACAIAAALCAASAAFAAVPILVIAALAAASARSARRLRCWLERLEVLGQLEGPPDDAARRRLPFAEPRHHATRRRDPAPDPLSQEQARPTEATRRRDAAE